MNGYLSLEDSCANKQNQSPSPTGETPLPQQVERLKTASYWIIGKREYNNRLKKEDEQNGTVFFD